MLNGILYAPHYPPFTQLNAQCYVKETPKSTTLTDMTVTVFCSINMKLGFLMINQQVNEGFCHTW